MKFVSLQAVFCAGLTLALLKAIGEAALTLPQKMNVIVSKGDTDGSGKLSQAEANHLASTYYDFNGDGCVTRSEFSQTFANATIDADITNAVFDRAVKIASTVPNLSLATCAGLPKNLIAMRTATWVPVFKSSFVADFTEVCHDHPTWYLEKSDCHEVPLTCQISEYACTYTCVNYIVDEVQGKLGGSIQGIPVDSGFFQGSSLLEAFDGFVRSFDPNGDGRATNPEVLKIHNSLYDFNRDGCVESTEFAGAWMFRQCGGYGLTEVAARQMWSALVFQHGGQTSTCKGYRVNFSGNGVAFSTMSLINNGLRSILNACEADRSRYTSNRDCRQLLNLCTYSKYNTYDVCRSYVNGVIKGIYGYSS